MNENNVKLPEYVRIDLIRASMIQSELKAGNSPLRTVAINRIINLARKLHPEAFGAE